MKLYLVEINEPTNRPGKYCHRKIFTNEEEAKKYVIDKIGDENDVETVEPSEWDDSGDNWKNIFTVQTEWNLFTIDEIDNGEEEITI